MKSYNSLNNEHVFAAKIPERLVFHGKCKQTTMEKVSDFLQGGKKFRKLS